MYYLFLIIVFVILIVKQSRLDKKVEYLESIIQNNTKKTGQANLISGGELEKSVHEEMYAVTLDNTSEKTEELIELKTKNEPSFSFFDWFKEDWMMKLGALLLLFGFAWLATYAFLNNWIGPVGRISMGMLGGLIILVLGEFRIKKHLAQGSVLLALGAAIVMLTIYAARQLYDFFTPSSALIIMALVSAFVAISSYRHSYKPLAVLGLVLGVVAPLLTDSPSPDMVGLFSYIFVVSAGFLWVVRLTKWRVLSLLSFIAVVFYSLVYINVKGEDKYILFAIISVFSLLYFFVTLLAIIKDKKAIKTDMLLAGTGGMYYLFWIGNLISDEYRGLLSAVAALIYILGAFLAFQFTRLKDSVYLYSGIGVILLGAATAFELNGSALTIAFILEAFVISVLATLLSKDIIMGEKVSTLMLIPMILSIRSMDLYRWRKNLIQEDFFILLIITAALLLLGAFFYRLSHGQPKEKQIRKNTAFHFIIGAVYALVFIRMILEPLVKSEDTAKTISLVIYTLVGIFFYLKGKFRDNKYFWLSGGLLLAYVGLRLLLIEVWQMDLVGRIITFFSIGTLLIASAFIKPKK